MTRLSGIAAVSAVTTLAATAACDMVPDPPIPSPEEVWIPQNAVVLDSAHVKGSAMAYLFWYDTGAFGYSVRMVSLRQPSHHPSALVLSSDHITGIRWRSLDTLVVELDADEYVAAPAPENIVIIPVVLAPRNN
jgi:hypothetical protein